MGLHKGSFRTLYCVALGVRGMVERAISNASNINEYSEREVLGVDVSGLGDNDENLGDPGQTRGKLIQTAREVSTLLSRLYANSNQTSYRSIFSCLEHRKG